MKLLFGVFFSLVLASPSYASRELLSPGITFAAQLRTGPALETSGYAVGGPHHGKGYTAADQYFSRQYYVSTTNVGTNDQKVHIEGTLSGVSWATPAETKVTLLAIDSGGNVIETKEVGMGAARAQPVSVKNIQYTIGPGKTVFAYFFVRFYGPTQFSSAYFNPRSTLTLKFVVQEDRGAVTASVADSLTVSIGGTNGALTAMDATEGLIFGANLGSRQIAINSGRPF